MGAWGGTDLRFL